MKFFLQFLTILLLSSSAVHGQSGELMFDDHVCTYKGTYNLNKYSRQQLQDTYQLVFDSFYISDEGSLSELSGKYARIIGNLDSLKLVENKYFYGLRDSLRNYLCQTYSLKRAQKLAREQPSLLISTVKKGSQACWYANALVQGQDSLLVAYKYMVERQMENNADPDLLFEEYQAVMRRVDREDIAFDNVLLYGWWNSANSDVDHVTDQRLMFENYLKLFTAVETIDCEEV